MSEKKKIRRGKSPFFEWLKKGGRKGSKSDLNEL
jgi:hypothetical protein